MENEREEFVLTDKQMEQVASRIACSAPGKDSLSLYDKERDVEVWLYYEVETEGYSENDYFNGTGGWCCTRAEVSITDTSLPMPNEQLDKLERFAEELIAG